MTTTKMPLHEPSAWLRGRINQRITEVRARGLDPNRDDTIILTPLGTTEDRGCDRCGRIVPDGDEFFVSSLHVLPGLMLVGGFCAGCGHLEMGGAR